MNQFPLVLLLAVTLAPATLFAADDAREVYVTEVDASVEKVWKAFTTSDGLKQWMAPLVEIELKVGGKLKSNYNAEGTIGDESTIENTILSFDPKRMISLKATGFPEGFPFAEAAQHTWSIFYFDEIAPTRTKITVVGLGYTDSEQSNRMREFFASANEYSLNQLKEALKTAE